MLCLSVPYSVTVANIRIFCDSGQGPC